MSAEEILNQGCEEVARFGRKLIEAGVAEDVENLQDYYESPWKWAAEYRLWTALGRPDSADASWDGFVEMCFRGEQAIRLYLFEHDPDASGFADWLTRHGEGGTLT